MQRAVVQRGPVSIAVWDLGGVGPTLLLLHGLAGSSRELIATAEALKERFRVLIVDQRGHGLSTRRPGDLSRDAFVADIVAVLEELAPGQRCVLVGQSMGAHTAFLVASARPDLVERLVMLEGHVAGSEDPGEAEDLGRYFASWPVSFRDVAAARDFLGDDAVAKAWIVDLEATPEGLVPRFDADVMERIIAAVHEPRWAEWESLRVPVLAVFAQNGMFTAEAKNELISRRPETARVDLASGSHDAHLDAFDEWITVLTSWLAMGAGSHTAGESLREPIRSGPYPRTRDRRAN